MTAFRFGTTVIDLPATRVGRRETSKVNAWLNGGYLTVKFDGEFEALRVHTKGKAFEDREASNEMGAWVVLGDLITTSMGLVSSRALPGDFTHVSVVMIYPRTVLNIGIAGAIAGWGMGGGEQGEYVGGPRLGFRPLDNKWHHAAGLA